ncbi:MAG: peptide chain release factor N(5)-glutamine methyltransferase [Thermoleophilia bacterium]
MLTLGEVLRRTTTYLGERGSSSPRLDADLLLAHALGMDRMQLYLEHDRPLTPAELEGARALVGRRGNGEPVAYILGTKAFRNLNLRVTPDVLVPRPDTEILVEWAIEAAPAGGSLLDWGTGSGAIALALADERPDLSVLAIDASANACAVAAGNGMALGIAISVRQSDGFDAVSEQFDVITANPPYLSDAELERAPRELSFEPRSALTAGPGGLEILTRIVAEAPAHLRPGGWLLCEVGEQQGEAVADLLRRSEYGDVALRNDLAGIARVVGGTRPSA